MPYPFFSILQCHHGFQRCCQNWKDIQICKKHKNQLWGECIHSDIGYPAVIGNNIMNLNKYYYPWIIFSFFLVQSSLYYHIACENIRFSSLFVAEDVSRGGTSATQWQKFHTDDANQCLHNKSGSYGVPNINLSNFACLLVDFGKLSCWSAHELQQNSTAS